MGGAKPPIYILLILSCYTLYTADGIRTQRFNGVNRLKFSSEFREWLVSWVAPQSPLRTQGLFSKSSMISVANKSLA